jgi:hypothetical protein
MRELNLDHLPTDMRCANGGWNKGRPRTWGGCGKPATKTINGVLKVELMEKYGSSAPYHMEKYGHLDNIGTNPGAKPGNTNARRRVIEGKSVSEWARELGVDRRRVLSWFEKHGTMKGCVPGKAGGWNKGKKNA